MKTYKNRIIEQLLSKKLAAKGAVLIEGPKWCGKTTTAEQQSRSILYMNDPKFMQNAELLADINLVGLLEGDTPRLIDEWQIIPKFWDTARFLVDRRGKLGQFIFTGSAVPADRTNIHHTGTGRFAWVTMRTMSLWESGDSSGNCSLASLFAGTQNVCASKEVSLEDICFLICRGGWPISVLAPEEISIEITKNYWNGLFVFEDCENERFRNKKPEVLKMIVRSYARHISTEAAISTIIADVRQSNERKMDEKTFDDYKEALQDLYILEDMPAWNPNIRSKTSIRSTPTRHFIDTSIACRALGVMPEDLMRDFETFGLFFEDMAVRDLRIYAGTFGGEVLHYRDNAGLECDAVIHLEDGRWGAVEIKLGGDDLIEAGANSLKRLKSKIEEKSDEKSPSFLMVLTATGGAYKREDGVYVAPINLLKP